MKKALVVMLAVLLAGAVAWAKTDYFDGITASGAVSFTGTMAFSGTTLAFSPSTSLIANTPDFRIGYDAGSYIKFAVADTTGGVTITHGGNATAVDWTVTTFGMTNATSHTVYTPSWVLGYDAGAAMTFTTTDTTGALAITHAGSGAAVTWTAPSLSFTGNFSSDGATAVLDGSTSVRNISAGFTSAESPANRLGVNSTVYMQVATTATTGVTAITHTGTGAAVTWTAPSLSFVGDFSSDGATALLDGSTSARLVSAGFVSSEAPAVRLGVNATEYMNVAVTATTGAVAITHTGNNKKVTWTTTGGFDFVGAFETDALTLSDVLTFSDAGTIDNTAADVLTITEGTVAVVGELTGSLDVDVKGGNVKNTTAGGGLSLDATAAAANTGTNFVAITGTAPIHASGSTTSRWLDINPTIGINTGAANFIIEDLTFSTPAWATAVASNVNAIYIAPTIGNATLGTNAVNLIEVAAITGDDLVALNAIKVGSLTATGAVENAIVIGDNWDTGISSGSPISATSTISGTTLTSSASEGKLIFSGATSATLSTTTAGVGLTLDALDAAAGSNMTYASISGSVPAHGAATPTSIFLDITPTVAVPTVTSTVNLIDLAFTTPAYATGGAVGTYRAIWLDPAIGAATNGTNTVALIDVDAITGDDTVSLYGIRAGAMTGTAAVEDFISVGAGWDHAIDAASPVKASTFIVDDGDADVIVDSDDQTAALPTINIPNFVDATADFLVTNTFTTTLPFAGGLRGEDTDSAGTNGGGLVGGAPDITTHTYTAGTDDVFVKVYDAGTTTWDDLSTSALLTAGADWAANYQLLPDADAEAAGDAFAVGFATQFCEVVFDDLATAAGALATWAANGGKWQYSTGAGTWSDLTVFDNTDLTAYDGLRSLQRTGAITFVPPADWATATYDGQLAYWIQYVIVDAQLTQTPLIDGTNHDEPFVAVPNADTFSAPFKLEITKVRVTNMGLTIHDQAIVFIVGNFTDGVFSAAQTWTASQLNDKFTLGTAIAADPGDLIGILVTNDTASTVNPIWAVEFEVTYED
jgi:hypothetical protein